MSAWRRRRVHRRRAADRRRRERRWQAAVRYVDGWLWSFAPFGLVRFAPVPLVRFVGRRAELEPCSDVVSRKPPFEPGD